MADAVDLEPTRFATLIAPAIDRTFVTAIEAPRYRGGRELVQKYGGSEAVGLMIDLRNVLAAGRALGPEIVQVSPYLYRDTDAVLDSLRRSAEAGLLETTDGAHFVASERGRSLLDELAAQHTAVLGERWAAHTDRVDRLNDVVGRLLAACAGSRGVGWETYFPIYEPAGTASHVVLLNRLQLLRHHRADAHVAAWQAAWLTAQEIVTMPSGAERDAIEENTSARAALPYAEISAEERLTMLADLAALP